MSSDISTQDAVEAWKLAHRFVLDVYKLTNRLPKEEHYGLTPKVRGSAVKIASNIVEGYSRKSNAVYLQHLSDSQAALEETKYSILVARDLGYISEHAYDVTMADAEAVGERLDGLNEQLTRALEQEPASKQPALAPTKKPAFHVTKGVRESVRDAWAWLRRDNKQRHQAEDNVWAEEVFPPPGYLSSGKDDKF